MAALKYLVLLVVTACGLVLANPPSIREESSLGVPIIPYDILYVPPSDYTDPEVLYARSVELTLSNNVLLATWENYSPEPPLVYFPIWRSTDHGASWKHISNVTDQVNDWGLRYQPFLYELPADIGGFEKGTVLLAGNSIPTNLSNTQIDLYASRDKGETWEFVSHVAAGGEALPDNGLTPVWEPFILYYNNQLVVYYSDQRLNATYGQRLVHQTSTDLRSWGEVVPDVEYPTYTDRPGMTTVTHLPNGNYLMTYEWGHYTDVATDTYSFPVTYRINSDPLKFNESIGQPLVAANTGTVPTGSPYVTWSSVGGKNGTLVVSCGGLSTVFTNTQLGAQDAWEEKQTSQPTSYTRSLRVFAEEQDRLLIMGAGVLPPSTTNNVSYSILSIEGLQSA
ncbi:hypothetical protein BD289DRAFT_377506 [Coniella lustricola]|uniref:Glycoside hydrolase family 93 protein n=1 Tax=Coniella lustricola TaxID=2025994 RepID=A0A2T2ZVE1_9PEZI|nr:hypothetical protein BD289DRAFT_377506 [Coniella lustricola]